MDGFTRGVDGYYDAEPQLSWYLRQRAAKQFAAERERKRSIDSRDSFEAHRNRIREGFLSSIGGLPDHTTGAFETTEIIESDGYTIELGVFESLPNVHVTANCYVPEADGPHPGLAFLCGHTETAKADPLTQKACIELALNGFVVLVIDPIAQGEREQYRDPETGEAIVSGGGGVFAHCYAGQQCFYAGANLARYMIHDARCGVDHLCGRSDVDSDRIGAIGTSGGGVQTSYLALVDDRLAAAVPCCAGTERSEWLKTGKRIDAEQDIHGAIPRGINYDDFLTAMAPRPVCVGAAASDEYFPVEGVHAAVSRARAIYGLYDARENVDLVLADTTHCSVYELGDEIFEWVCDQLGDCEYVSHDALPVRDPPDLRCTPDGSVRSAYPEERTVDDLLREYVVENPVPDEREQHAKRLRRTLIETLDLDRGGCELHPRYTRTDQYDDQTVEHVFFKTERDPDIVVTGVLVTDSDAPTRSPAVMLYEHGTEELPERSAAVAALAAEHGAAFVFDPRGVGAVRNRDVPIPPWVEGYNDIYGTEFKLAYDALLLGSSLFGMRVYDVLRAIEFLREETESERATLRGAGVGAYHALYAAAVDRSVETIHLRNLGPSFHEMATSHQFRYDPRLTVFDVIGDCDVPQLIPALDDRDIQIDRTH